MSRLLSASIGAGCCIVAATGLTPLLSESSLRSFAPLLLLVVIVLVAIRFGNFAGMVGTIAGAVVFEIFLFRPRFSLLVEDTDARNHLIWMVIIGLIVSDLLGAYSEHGEHIGKHS
jgi:K+-sensing histidine kinase KdpD